jgi:hypothetical protein
MTADDSIGVSLNKQTRILLVVAAVLVLVVGAAWALELTSGSGDDDPYTITIMRDGEVLAVFDLEALKAMESRRIVMQASWQEGPPLLTVLEAAGVDQFDSVLVRGLGVRDSGRIELSRDEVTEDVLLDFALRGTTKVCGPDIAWADRVRDVDLIEVR